MSERKTWQEWDEEGIDGLYVLDPDGFRDNPVDKPYTRDEFIETRSRATVGPARSLPRFRARWGAG